MLSLFLSLAVALVLVVMIFGLTPWWMPPLERPVRSYMEWLDRRMP
jgi:hypothetical protein